MSTFIFCLGGRAKMDTLSDKISADKSAENLAYCRKFCPPKNFVGRKFCPPKILSAEILSDKVFLWRNGNITG